MTQSSVLIIDKSGDAALDAARILMDAGHSVLAATTVPAAKKMNARKSGPSQQALANFYQGLVGHFDAKKLEEYIIQSLKALTGAALVELELAEALDDSVSPFETEAYSHLNDFGPERHNPRPLPHRLAYELGVNGCALGELFVYFEHEDDASLIAPNTMREVTQTIANALFAVKKYQKAVTLAAKDGLTGLYNRRIFNEVLKREFAKARRHKHSLSLLSLDLDHFKEVNDNFGHQTGDMVLKAVARIIAQVARNTDLAARVGGEEFAVILPHTTEEQAFFLAERLRKILKETPLEVDGTIFHQTVSQGVVGNEDFMVNSPDDMVYWADQALYRAKREGRDTIRVASELAITPITKDGAYAFQ